jgi:hypothetical protein
MQLTNRGFTWTTHLFSYWCFFAYYGHFWPRTQD